MPEADLLFIRSSWLIDPLFLLCTVLYLTLSHLRSGLLPAAAAAWCSSSASLLPAAAAAGWCLVPGALANPTFLLS